jgi:metallopeptidase MepB
MAAAQYQTPPQPPPLFTYTAASIISETERLNADYKKLLDDIVGQTQPENATFAKVLSPVLADDNVSCKARRIMSFYQHVSPHDELREASTKADEITNEFDIECKMREDVFNVVNGAFEQRASESLDVESLRVLEKERKRYIRNGLLIPAGEKRDRFKEIQKRLGTLCIQAQKNLNEEKGAIWFTPEELKGVPEDDINIDELEKGTGENEGKVKLGFKYNHYFALIKYAHNPETRRRYLVADANKVNKNVPLFQEIITLRDEAARLLGYPDHASVRVEEKMAKNPTTINEFLGGLRGRLLEGGKQDIAKLLEYKKKDCEEKGIPFDGNFYMWDTSYYSRIQKEKEYSIDEIAISQYFPVDSTFKGMLKIFEEIFGLVFVEIKEEDRKRISSTGKAEDIVWHEDVHLYSVWNGEDGGNEFVGYLYIDLHPRDNKYGHNANFGIDPGYLKEDGTRNYPSTALVCNFSKPSATKPSLLKHHEVVTLFHELGHGIHDLVARTRYSYFHGTSVVDDFVEAPSQMLENWCWTPSVLKSLSHNWETNEQIPDGLIEKLISTKNLNSATQNLAQLLIGTFDMTIHTPKSHEAVKELDAGKLWNTLRGEITGIKGPEDVGEGLNWGNRHANIGHFIGGYDAGYYGYLWSEVFSADMFHSFFKKNPMDKEQGRRYRKTVLEKGGSRDEMEFLTEFLGRPPNSEAFYKELGLSS